MGYRRLRLRERKHPTLQQSPDNLPALEKPEVSRSQSPPGRSRKEETSVSGISLTPESIFSLTRRHR